MENIVDLRPYALMLEEDCVHNGFGEAVSVVAVLKEFSAASAELKQHILADSIPANFRLFVPDLWHVAKGDARCFPPGDGNIIWDMAAAVYLLARDRFGVEEKVSQHNHPGTLFSVPA